MFRSNAERTWLAVRDAFHVPLPVDVGGSWQCLLVKSTRLSVESPTESWDSTPLHLSQPIPVTFTDLFERFPAYISLTLSPS